MSDVDRRLAEVASAVAELRFDLAADATRRALAAGATREAVIERALLPGLDTVGDRYESGRYFVPHLLRASDTAHEVLSALPAAGTGHVERGTVLVLGTVAGDVHDIGKNLVRDVVRASGRRVVDIGVDCPAERFVSAVEEHGAGLVGLSAMMTTAFGPMERTVARIKEELDVPILVGGAPVTAEFAGSIGADGYADSAVSALREVGRLEGMLRD